MPVPAHMTGCAHNAAHAMESTIMFELSDLGFGPFFSRQLESESIDTAIPARISAEHRGSYEVWSQAGQGQAQLAGRLLQELDQEEFPGVGDWVTLKSQPGSGQTTIIERVLNRRTVFTRGAAGRETRGQVVAANVDIVFAVCGLDADYSVRRIERYLARIWAGGATPVVILNKADIREDAAALAAEVEERCPAVPVHLTSALHTRGLEEIRSLIGTGITTAFVGSSGAGKSTLINALLGEQRMATGEVRARDGRGRHTTSHRQLLLLPGGGLLLDTPGMRELQLVDDRGIETVFADIEELSAQCRFRDCTHGSEPGCAVKRAVNEGRLAAERLDHYRKLGREAQAFEQRRDEHTKRKSDRELQRMYNEVKRIKGLKHR